MLASSYDGLSDGLGVVVQAKAGKISAECVGAGGDEGEGTRRAGRSVVFWVVLRMDGRRGTRLRRSCVGPVGTCDQAREGSGCSSWVDT